MTTLSLIVAMDAARGIGIDNTLPWRLPEDLAHFKRLTTGHPIIMGRKTFESIGRPLPNRRNIVITSNPDWFHEGVERAASVPQALALVQGGDGAGDASAFVIGGAQVYAQTLDLAQQVIVTEIAHSFACDAFFPPLDPAAWTETAREPHHSASNGFDYAFVTYSKAS
ncbi:dihydrofolate reductase [Massilia sp. CCM 8695]|uniref:Dihydrofolate reductase n=1 Tax=Massilia frigida TaxID=2609281 RepID=A0ABX0NJW6_9BURK|nr:dihydrofolate reductase [Massilia frigida]NHZ82480.1 dihydrofolate reductase [Massilia frigida]